MHLLLNSIRYSAILFCFFADRLSLLSTYNFAHNLCITSLSKEGKQQQQNINTYIFIYTVLDDD